MGAALAAWGFLAGCHRGSGHAPGDQASSGAGIRRRRPQACRQVDGGRQASQPGATGARRHVQAAGNHQPAGVARGLGLVRDGTQSGRHGNLRFPEARPANLPAGIGAGLARAAQVSVGHDSHQGAESDEPAQRRAFLQSGGRRGLQDHGHSHAAGISSHQNSGRKVVGGFGRAGPARDVGNVFLLQLRPDAVGRGRHGIWRQAGAAGA